MDIFLIWDKEKEEYVKTLHGKKHPRIYSSYSLASSAAFHLVSPTVSMDGDAQRERKKEKYIVHHYVANFMGDLPWK